MTGRDVLSLIDALHDEQALPCVGGGWAVDALLGEQTRLHSDVDLWVPAAHLEHLFTAFARVGVDRICPWPGDRPWNFVLHDGDHLRVDLHLYEERPDGTFHYGSATGTGAVIPADALSGEGLIEGVSVRCDSAEWALACHTGYAPRAVDFHDVPRLCERFGFPLPPDFT